MRILLLALALLFVGCAMSSKMNHISLGMTKQEVIDIMGSPVSTSAAEGMEYLNYNLSETGFGLDDALLRKRTPYYVRFKDGKVESYGRFGDFDSTKHDNKSKITIDLNTNK